MAAPNSSDKPPFPIVTAAQIDAARSERRHWLNMSAVRRNVCISDMAGMKGKNLGVHHTRVDPGVETTEMHHHMNEAEWMYILKGSATVKLTECAFQDTGMPTNGLVPALPHSRPIDEYAVGPGDFIGFPGGYGRHYAHTMVAGAKGVEYLVGGTREPLDICTYPLKETTAILAGQPGGGPRARLDSKELKEMPIPKKPE